MEVSLSNVRHLIKRLRRVLNLDPFWHLDTRIIPGDDFVGQTRYWRGLWEAEMEFNQNCNPDHLAHVVAHECLELALKEVVELYVLVVDTNVPEGARELAKVQMRDTANRFIERLVPAVLKAAELEDHPIPPTWVTRGN